MFPPRPETIKHDRGGAGISGYCSPPDSNREPAGYESVALTVELGELVAVVSEGGRPSTSITGGLSVLIGSGCRVLQIEGSRNRIQRKIFLDKITMFFHGIQFFSGFVYNEGFCFSVYRYQLMQAFVYSCV